MALDSSSVFWRAARTPPSRSKNFARPGVSLDANGDPGWQRAVEVRDRAVRRGAQRRDLHPLVLEACQQQLLLRGLRGWRVERPERGQQLEAHALVGVARSSPSSALATAGCDSQRSASTMAFSRTPASGSFRACSTVRRPRGGRGPPASRARAAGPAPSGARAAIATSAGAASRRLPCTSSRCAVRRHQTLRAAECLDQLRVGGRPEPRPLRRPRGRRAGRGDDTVDTAAILARREHRRVLLQVARGPLRVLDVRAVVVDHVQRAVGPDVEVHGPEPAVLRRQELHVRCARGWPRTSIPSASARRGAPGCGPARR